MECDLDLELWNGFEKYECEEYLVLDGGFSFWISYGDRVVREVLRRGCCEDGWGWVGEECV